MLMASRISECYADACWFLHSTARLKGIELSSHAMFQNNLSSARIGRCCAHGRVFHHLWTVSEWCQLMTASELCQHNTEQVFIYSIYANFVKVFCRQTKISGMLKMHRNSFRVYKSFVWHCSVLIVRQYWHVQLLIVCIFTGIKGDLQNVTATYWIHSWV